MENPTQSSFEDTERLARHSVAARKSPVTPSKTLPRIEKGGTPLSRRDRLSVTLATTVLVAALTAKYGEAVKDTVGDAFGSATGKKYTNEQLASFPQKAVTVHTGEGALDEIKPVDPNLSGQGLHDVIDYVNGQGQDPGHRLHDLQLVNVPIIPEK